MVERAEASNAGCWLDGARGWRIALGIVEEAEAWGYRPSAEFANYRAECDENDGDPAEYEFIQEEADDAEAWMNEHVAPKGYYFGTHPDFGDWGLYGNTMGRNKHDIAGGGPYDTEDLLDFISYENPQAIIVFDEKSIPVQEVLRDEERCGLPEFTDVDFVNGDAYFLIRS